MRLSSWVKLPFDMCSGLLYLDTLYMMLFTNYGNDYYLMTNVLRSLLLPNRANNLYTVSCTCTFCTNWANSFYILLSYISLQCRYSGTRVVKDYTKMYALFTSRTLHDTKTSLTTSIDLIKYNVRITFISLTDF